MSSLRAVWPLLRSYRVGMAIGVVVVLAWTLLSLATPALVGYGIDEGIGKHDTGAVNKAALGLLGAGLLAYVLFRVQTYVISRVAEGFLYDLRIRVFDHLQSLSMGFYDRQRSGVLVSRMTSDVDALSQLTQNGLFTLVTATFSLVFAVVIMTALSPLLMLVCAVVYVPVLVATRRFQRRARVAYGAIQDEIGGTLASAQEGLSGVRVIQVMGAGERVVGKFGSRNRRLYRAHLRAARLNAGYFPLVEGVGLANIGVIVIVGGLLATHGSVTLGTVVAFVLYSEQLFGPVLELGQVLRLAQAAGAGLRNVVGILRTRSELPEPADAVELPAGGALELAGVSFGYESGRQVLSGIDLSVPAGERLALVGPTGAGKSTLAKLVARWYDPTAGRVCFGGVDLRHATLESLRERIAVVPQEGFLFAGTIRDNVRLARHGAHDDDVDDALRAVGAYRLFSALPDGLETVVHARGSQLSAGERQLVSLARVALARPAVLILDEATSQLDPVTERAVEHALDRISGGRTVIVIAHRLTTAAQADRVALVDDGGIVELGRHEELVAAGGRYAALYGAWLGSGQVA
jgi:ATP-binding cassette subfamily B protein